MWPGGARCAVAFTFDFDAESVWIADDPANAARPGVLSQGAYGAKVAVPLILELLDRHGVRGTFFVVGEVAERYPERVDAIVGAGHELAAHGYTHTPPARLSREEEERELSRARSVLERFGAPITGYRSPSWDFSPHTLDLLEQHGFRYSSNLMDDVRPYRHERRRLVELPVQWLLDDAAHWWFGAADWTKKISTTAEVRSIWEEELVGIRELGGCCILTMHPQVIGRPSRLAFLDAFLGFVEGLEGAWIATCDEIARCASRDGAAEGGPAGRAHEGRSAKPRDRLLAGPPEELAELAPAGVATLSPKGLMIGYADRLSVRPGETVAFKVSCPARTYRADLVRLLHGDENPAGPGFREEELEPLGEHPGRVQPLRPGSYAIVSPAPVVAGSFAVSAWIYATTPGLGQQGLVTCLAGSRGWGLLLGPDGGLELRVGGFRIHAPAALRPHTWYLVAGSYHAATGEVSLHVNGQVVAAGSAGPFEPGDAPLLLGACWSEAGEAACFFNGKLAAPRLEAGGEVVASWDLAADIPTTFVRDSSPNGLHGRTVNMPARGVTGPSWSGSRWCWRDAPGEYDAIHFHDDDLDDAGWETDFELTVPPGLASGVYAARLRTDGAEDHVPLVVRPAGPAAEIAVLLPTFTYMAYANEPIFEPHEPLLERDEDRWAAEQRLRSLYNWHSDGSGVCYASRLRPMTNLRPRYRYWLTGHPHGLGADLCVLDWLEQAGHRHDVLTDEDLHRDGVELLRPYRVLLTGAHPEYATASMLRALEAFVEGGGRLMYLGGNGFWMVTGVHEERPHVIEIRRRAPTSGLWGSEPGEVFLSTTGELGDTWQHRRERPRRLVGVGFERMVLEGRPYRRQPGSFDPRVAFVFEGIGADEPIGDFGLLFGGAASYEVDGVDVRYGTPPHALLLARAAGFTPVGTPELDHQPRADMVFFDAPGGGAVFATGSIGWSAALSHDGYANNVSRITGNVLRAFLQPGQAWADDG